MRASLYDYWYPARDKAGRPDLRFHDLRHTGAVLAASTGATLADLMARLGHSSPATAMRYQHASADRDSMIADRLTEIAGGSVVPLRPWGRTVAEQGALWGDGLGDRHDLGDHRQCEASACQHASQMAQRHAPGRAACL